jgi:hypothetical protein
MYLAASLIYWVMATVLSTLQNYFENQLNRQCSTVCPWNFFTSFLTSIALILDHAPGDSADFQNNIYDVSCRLADLLGDGDCAIDVAELF